MRFDLSPDDTARWRVRSAKAFVTSRDEVRTLVDSCRRCAVRLAIVRCPAEETPTAQALESEGMRLMDTLVFFARSLHDWPSWPRPQGVATRDLEPADIAIVERIAREAFRGYGSHYHADERLDPAQCDDLYVDWSLRLCQPADYPSHVLLATVDGEPAGYMAFRQRPGEDAEAILGGVLDKARRRGVYGALLADGLTWLSARGAENAMLSTQIANVAVQRVWTRFGFEPHHALYTFHGWF